MKIHLYGDNDGATSGESNVIYPRVPSLKDLPPPPSGRSGWPWTEESPAPPPLRTDLRKWPRITIVTPAHNQGQFLEETIRSVLLQRYPNLEYIIINAGSTDHTEEVIRRYSRWLVYWANEPDRGHFYAINRGFLRATGTILGYLNSDDLLLPGALAHVASEIDRGLGRHVIMGRCRFVDTDSNPTGEEHPSYFRNHFRVLQVWKGHQIPQPSVFWTSEVWSRCGPMQDENGLPWIDYGLFCRISRYYSFHCIEPVLSAYRFHDRSKTQSTSESQRLEESIAISSKYWGSRWALQYWRLRASLALHRWDRLSRGRKLRSLAHEAGSKGRSLSAVILKIATAILVPGAAFFCILYPRMRPFLPPWIQRKLLRLFSKNNTPQKRACSKYRSVWPDSWAGNDVTIPLVSRESSHSLMIAGNADTRFLVDPLVLRIYLNDGCLGETVLTESGEWSAAFSLHPPVRKGLHNLRVVASTSFVPDDFLSNGDYRTLAWRMVNAELK